MSLSLTEFVESRESVQGKGPDGNTRTLEVTRRYVLEGTSDDATARTLLASSTPSMDGDLERADIRLVPQWVDTAAGDGVWDAEVKYILPEKAEPEVGDSSFSFDTGGGTQHITQSLENLDFQPAAGESATNYDGAIGVGGSGTDLTVQGTDLTVPVYHWSETHYLPDSQVTEAYRGALFRLTGKTNDAPFKGCAAGECLSLGASGSKRGEDDWEVTFRYAASPNKTNWRPPTFVALGFPAIDKKGWEYIWFRYAVREAAGTGILLPKPVAVYVEKVYEDDDFSDFGIGT